MPRAVIAASLAVSVPNSQGIALSSEDFAVLNRLYRAGRITFATRGLAHPMHDDLLRAVIAQQTGAHLQQLGSGLRWVCEVAALIWLAFFSQYAWWWSVALLTVVLVAEQRFASNSVQAMILRTALADEELFETLWEQELLGISEVRSRHIHVHGHHAPRSWREVVREFARKHDSAQTGSMR